jgi:hypothetical protein
MSSPLPAPEACRRVVQAAGPFDQVGDALGEALVGAGAPLVNNTAAARKRFNQAQKALNTP